MRKSLRLPVLALLFLAGIFTAQAQTQDTTIYEVAEFMPFPLLNSCNPNLHLGWNEDSIRRCAENQLMQILASNIRYPEEARQKDLQGTVVIGFVVEKNGKMSHYSLLKDIGGGCGEEALRVLKALDEAGLSWQPARTGGKIVRMKTALPIRFRLEENLPYLLNERGDTVYTIVDSLPSFRYGADSLVSFLLNRVEYPKEYLDSCRTGIIEMALLILPNQPPTVENQLDYSNLGLEFQFQAIRLANRTAGMWTPAYYEGRPVGTTYPLRVLFKSPRPGCAAANDRFDRAMLLAEEGAQLAEQDKQEEAIAKWTEALALHPNNTELLYYRGSAYFALNRREEGCADFNAVKALLGITWFESIRKVLCGW